MSEDCQKCGTAMYELDEDRNCPGCSDYCNEDVHIDHQNLYAQLWRESPEELEEASVWAKELIEKWEEDLNDTRRN